MFPSFFSRGHYLNNILFKEVLGLVIGTPRLGDWIATHHLGINCNDITVCELIDAVSSSATKKTHILSIDLFSTLEQFVDLLLAVGLNVDFHRDCDWIELI